MSSIKHNSIITALIVIAMICSPLLLQAQPGGDEDLGDPGVPLDGGLSILIGAAVGYGASKLRKKDPGKKESNDVK